jgi:hypothetical protein
VTYVPEALTQSTQYIALFEAYYIGAILRIAISY